MEIFMRNISFSSNQHQVVRDIAVVLHNDDSFARLSPTVPSNFEVRLFIKGRRTGAIHSGQGSLTLPTEDMGGHFLHQFGGDRPTRLIYTHGRQIKFSPSKNTAQFGVVDKISRTPYRDPDIVEREERKIQQLKGVEIPIRCIQFGWDCRDSSFSAEWNYSGIRTNRLTFDHERRAFRIFISTQLDSDVLPSLLTTSQQYSFEIRSSQVDSATVSSFLSDEPAIHISLLTPPSFECELKTSIFEDIFGGKVNPSVRQRLSALPLQDDVGIPHSLHAPYTSFALRLVCNEHDDIERFFEASSQIGFRGAKERDITVQRRGLFSPSRMEEFFEWVKNVDYKVAFQLESIMRRLALDMKEMLDLRSTIQSCIDSEGSSYAAGLLAMFGNRALLAYQDYSEETILKCFSTSRDEYDKQSQSDLHNPLNDDPNIFQCLHVNVTPTSLRLDGPFPERSNRILRWYPNHHDCFLRVSFVDEGNLQFRFDPREVDGKGFIRERFGEVLLNGLYIAGHRFEFLAYSQSALKEHTVYFMRPFQDDNGTTVDATAIIGRLGNFENLEYDPGLIRCPARFAARISQTLSATDASISVTAEEIHSIPDIKTDDWCFTDGHGTMSAEVAEMVHEQLRVNRRRAHRLKHRPSAIQVRVQGAKGMLSVNHKLSGCAVCLTPSMIKFEAPNSMEIEICRVFDTPGRYFLNRPLIMILEGLGVDYNVFQQLQDNAVDAAVHSVETLESSAKLLETHGLAASFRLPSIMLNLYKLGQTSLEGNKFYDMFMLFSINHVLRELKHKARIPVPGGWTLVGVADVHGYLKEGQVFACIWPLHTSPSHRKYLRGDILISRSPTIHPGDVQIAYAIGSPPPDSPFFHEKYANCVVFSTKGQRPLPSCLGGGDLDGDEYNIIPLDNLPQFRPKKRSPPGEYTPAPKMYLDRPSNKDDIARFVMEYISSDVLGLVAINWLIVADQSSQGIFDSDCLTLANLHSDAVDYPKSGTPVPLEKIPRLSGRIKPDWNAPETINPNAERYYESQRAIGKLFRAIALPAIRTQRRIAQRARRGIEDQEAALHHLEQSLTTLNISNSYSKAFLDCIKAHVARYVTALSSVPEEQADSLKLFQKYTSELQRICTTYSLSQREMLTEEEAIVGTIVAKSSQWRMRKEQMARLREQTGLLVRMVRDELARDEEGTSIHYLKRSWLAWKTSLLEGQAFGAFSFGWVALGAMFEAIKEIEEY